MVKPGTALAMVLMALILVRGTPPAQAKEVALKHNGLTLNGNLEMAPGKTLADGMILITHSLLQHNRREPLPHVQALLRERGYSSLAINYGLAIDDRHGPYDCAAPHRYTLEDSLAEIGVWIDWLKQRGATRLVLAGHSYGGNEVARYTANNDEAAIKGVVLLGAGTADHRGWSPEGYRILYGKDLGDILQRAELLVASGRGAEMMEAVDFLFCPRATVSARSFASYYRVSPERLLPNLIKAARKPTLFIAASEDNRMPDLDRLVKPHVDGTRLRLVVIDGAGHFFLDLFADDAVDEMVRFFRDIKY